MKEHTPIFALSALVFGSCSDFLDVQPGGSTTDNYFTNDRQAMSAIDGLYGFIHQEDGFGRELFGNKELHATLYGPNQETTTHWPHLNIQGVKDLCRAHSNFSITPCLVPTGLSRICLPKKEQKD